MKYSRDSRDGLVERGVLDAPPEPVIRPANGRTGWRGMTALGGIKFSDLLIVLADFRMGAQHAIDRGEHVAHALLGHRALDDHHELRLVG